VIPTARVFQNFEDVRRNDYRYVETISSSDCMVSAVIMLLSNFAR